MTKMISQFRVSCLKLLSLMYGGFLKPEEEGHHSNYSKGNKTVSYRYGYKLELHKLIDDLFKIHPEIQENSSREYIEKKINDFLFDCFFDSTKNKTDKIDAFFKQLKDDLKHSETYLVPLLIENLSLDSEITIGTVRFLPYSEDNYKKIFQEAGYTIKNGADLLNVRTTKRVSSMGVVTVSAREYIKAIEKAEELIEQALNIIRFFNIYNDFGIVGQYNNPQNHDITTFNINTQSFSSSMEWSGDITGCRFTKSRYDELWKDYISNIDSVLKKPEPQRKTMENKLLVAFNWFGELLKNRNHKENIIRIFSALEALLVLTKNEEKGDNVAERLAFINYPDREARLFVYSLVKRMYKHRNELVHEGKTKFKELDYNTLFIELHNCMGIIAHHINKYPNLENWIELIKEAKFDTKLIFQ